MEEQAVDVQKQTEIVLAWELYEWELYEYEQGVSKKV